MRTSPPHKDEPARYPSVTVYQGENLINKVNEAGYGWVRDNSPGFTETNDFNSFIVNATLEPMEGMGLSAYFNPEPGDTDRNTTAGASFHTEIANFIFDAEYIGVLSREKHVTDNREYNENAWFVSIGYQIIDPLMIAARYESSDADRSAAGNLENRCSVGATYTLYENDFFVCNLMGEYRRSDLV